MLGYIMDVMLVNSIWNYENLLYMDIIIISWLSHHVGHQLGVTLALVMGHGYILGNPLLCWIMLIEISEAGVVGGRLFIIIQTF